MAMTFDIRHPECYWQTPPKFPKGVSSNLVAQHDISKVVEACADKMLWGSRYGQSRNGETHAKARDWHWLRASMLQSWWLLICMKLLTANCSKRRFRFLLQRWQKRLQLCTGCVLCTRLVLETEAHLLKLKQTCVTSKEFKDTQQILKHMLAACLYLLCLHENWSYENSWGREAMAPTTPQPSLPAAVSSLPQVMPQESPLQHREAKEGKHWRGQPCHAMPWHAMPCRSSLHQLFWSLRPYGLKNKIWSACDILCILPLHQNLPAPTRWPLPREASAMSPSWAFDDLGCSCTAKHNCCCHC